MFAGIPSSSGSIGFKMARSRGPRDAQSLGIYCAFRRLADEHQCRHRLNGHFNYTRRFNRSDVLEFSRHGRKMDASSRLSS